MKLYAVFSKRGAPKNKGWGRGNCLTRLTPISTTAQNRFHPKIDLQAKISPAIGQSLSAGKWCRFCYVSLSGIGLVMFLA